MKNSDNATSSSPLRKKKKKKAEIPILQPHGGWSGFCCLMAVGELRLVPASPWDAGQGWPRSWVWGASVSLGLSGKDREGGWNLGCVAFERAARGSAAARPGAGKRSRRLLRTASVALSGLQS